MQEYSFTGKHMGTEVVLSFVTPTEQLATEIADSVFETIAAYEDRFSRFKDTSELSQLNRTHDMQVSETFFTVLQKCQELHRLTYGAFNPLVQIARHGYVQSFDTLSGEQPVTPANVPYDTDFDTIVANPSDRHVQLQTGQALDVGGMLKGYLAGELTKTVQQTYPACVGAIINLGGDLATCGHDVDGKPFECFVYNPVTNETLPITLEDSCLVTSGTYKRTWQTASGTRHHVLDATGSSNPDTTIISASVLHPDGAIAEAYAKVLLIHGVAAAAADYSDLQYLTISSDGTYQTNLSL